MKFKVLLVIVLFTIVSGCSDTNIILPTYPSQGNVVVGGTNNPTPVPTPVVTAKIEFRVSGNASSATVRHSDSLNGLTQVTTTLPYFTIMNSSQSSIFVSLEATPISYPFQVVSPFMAVQIFINGLLFREATSSSFLLNTVSVSGTWRTVQ